MMMANSSPPSREKKLFGPSSGEISCGHPAEKLVAGSVAQRIVDLLEAVEVEQQQGSKLCRPARTGSGSR